MESRVPHLIELIFHGDFKKVRKFSKLLSRDESIEVVKNVIPSAIRNEKIIKFLLRHINFDAPFLYLIRKNILCHDDLLRRESEKRKFGFRFLGCRAYFSTEKGLVILQKIINRINSKKLKQKIFSHFLVNQYNEVFFSQFLTDPIIDIYVGTKWWNPLKVKLLTYERSKFKDNLSRLQYYRLLEIEKDNNRERMIYISLISFFRYKLGKIQFLKSSIISRLKKIFDFFNFQIDRLDSENYLLKRKMSIILN